MKRLVEYVTPPSRAQIILRWLLKAPVQRASRLKDGKGTGLESQRMHCSWHAFSADVKAGMCEVCKCMSLYTTCKHTLAVIANTAQVD